MFSSKINNSLNNYLSICDLINKYNFKSVYNAPKVEKIVIDFNIFDFLAASDFKDKEQTDSNVQVQAAALLYILTGFISYINFNKSLSSIKKLKISENNFSLKVSISNSKEIETFLFTFFIENWSKLLAEDFLFFKNLQKNPLKNASAKSFVFSNIVPASCFFELESFLTKTITGVNPKNLNFKINFLFKTPINFKNSQNLIKNLPYFWISG